MVDYKKGFEILKEKLELEVQQVAGCKRIWYLIGVCETDEEVTKEEYECLNECLNAEPDSIDKVLEEFEKLEYEPKPVVNKDNSLILRKLEPRGRVYLNIFEDSIDKYLSSDYSKYIKVDLKFEELKLINRIYRLWGKEV